MAVAVPIISTFDNKGVRQAEGAFGGLSKKVTAMGAAVAAAAGVAAAALGKMVMAAAEDQKSFTLLAQTLSKVAGASEQMIAATDKQIGKMAMATGIADDQLRPALANLVRATGSLSLSQTALNQVMDLSVSKQIDMDAASNAVAKALAGNTTALVKMLPGLKGIIDNGSSAAEVLAAIDSQVGGAAAAAADTFAGKITRLKLVLGEMAETIGSWLLPAISAVADFLNTYLIQAFTFLSDVVGPKVTASMEGLSRVFREDIVPFIQDYVLPAFKALAEMYYGTLFQAVAGLVRLLVEKLGKAFDMIREKIEGNRETFDALVEGLRRLVTFFQQVVVPLYFKYLSTLLDVAIKALGIYIDMWLKVGKVLIPVVQSIGSAAVKIGGFIADAINMGIDALNVFINAYNRLPGFLKPGGNIDIIPNVVFKGLDFTQYKPGGFGTVGDFRGGMTGAVPGAGGLDLGAALPPSSSGGKAGAAAPGAVDPLAGMTPEQIAAGRANADFFAMGLDNPIVRRGAPITVNVNGGLATSADIGQAVVDAIKQYTNVSGPVDIPIR